MSDNIIKIKNLKKVFKVRVKSKEGMWASVRLLFKGEYKLVTAVDGLSMNVKRGEIKGLIGPNGAGKSTTIKIISGILFPSEGTVDVLGFTPWLQRREYVRHIGVLFGQKTQLFWDLPPMDTFLLHREMYKIPEKRFRKNVAYFKQVLQLEEVVKRPVRNLSLGERMKCELVCAMLHEPELVYLDEPTIGLDLFAKESIRNYIKRIKKEKNTTFILTTHDLNEIENICENVSIINKGKIVYNGALENLSSFFTKRKIIEVKFTRKTDTTALGNFKIVSSNPFSVKIEVDLTKNKIQDVVYGIFNVLPVQDINIQDVGIEDIIKQIYTR